MTYTEAEYTESLPCRRADALPGAAARARGWEVDRRVACVGTVVEVAVEAAVGVSDQRRRTINKSAR